MNRVILLIYVFSLFYSPSLVLSKDILHVSNAFYGEDMDEVSYKNAKVAMRLWLEKFSKEAGLSSDAKFYTNFHTIKKEVIKNNIDSLLLSPYSYLKNIKFCQNNFTGGWIKKEKDGKPFFRYLIIARKDGKPKKRLLVHYYTYNKLSEIVARKYAIKHEFSITTESTKKKSKAILDLFFKKCDLAVATQGSWDLMKELNPQIDKKLKVIYRSDRIFVDLISMFSKKMLPRVREAYYKAILTFGNTQTGGQLMRLFKFDGLMGFQDNQLEPLIRFYNEYLYMEKKHAK